MNQEQEAEIVVTELPVSYELDEQEDRALDADAALTASLLGAFRARAFEAGYDKAMQDVRVCMNTAAEQFMFESAVSLGMRHLVLDFGDFLTSYLRKMSQERGYVADGLGI